MIGTLLSKIFYNHTSKFTILPFKFRRHIPCALETSLGIFYLTFEIYDLNYLLSLKSSLESCSAILNPCNLQIRLGLRVLCSPPDQASFIRSYERFFKRKITLKHLIKLLDRYYLQKSIP